MDFEKEPKLIVTPDNTFRWKPRSELLEGECELKPCEVAPKIVGDGIPLPPLLDLEKYVRQAFSVPDDITVANNYCYSDLRLAVAEAIFLNMDEAFREAVEGIVDGIFAMRAAL